MTPVVHTENMTEKEKATGSRKHCNEGLGLDKRIIKVELYLNDVKEFVHWINSG
jgi:hypothetical protein